MRRNVMLISIAITAFTLVIMASVVYGYRVSAQPRMAAPEVGAQPGMSAELVAAASVPTTRISARQAAAVASEFLGRTDAYAVQMADYNGVQAYKVMFSSGDVVYVSLDGQVLGSQPPGVNLASLTHRTRDRDDDGGAGQGGDDGDHAGEDREAEPEHEAGG